MNKHPLILMTLVTVHFHVAAQPSQKTKGDNITKKFKDSLNISESEANSIFRVNEHLIDEKKKIWQQHTNGDSLTYYIQQIENKRDSFYRLILVQKKYVLYKHKKKSLVSGD